MKMWCQKEGAQGMKFGGTHHPQSKLQLEQSTIEPVYSVMIFTISFLIQLTRHCILPDLATSSMST